MKEYLVQRLKELEEWWNETHKKYWAEENEKKADYYYYKLNEINASIREVKNALYILTKVEETK
jgi:hypothetical protein